MEYTSEIAQFYALRMQAKDQRHTEIEEELSYLCRAVAMAKGYGDPAPVTPSSDEAGGAEAASTHQVP